MRQREQVSLARAQLAQAAKQLQLARESIGRCGDAHPPEETWESTASFTRGAVSNCINELERAKAVLRGECPT